jgi:phosphoenolpyruvate carboxylase
MPHRTEGDRHLHALLKLLGGLVGETVRAHDGEAAYAAVERLRAGFVAARRAGEPKAAEVAKLAAGLRAIDPAETDGISLQTSKLP